MKIIAGKARSIELDAPDGDAVRPTLARSRKALFDSLGDFEGAKVADLFAGSGALGLESASRGAAELLLIENHSAHCRVIERNIDKVRRTGVETEIRLLHTDASNAAGFPLPPEGGFDVIFADPPYAQSGEYFDKLLRQETFRRWASEALLIWEIPDTPGAAGAFVNRTELETWKIRQFGATSFLIGMMNAF